MASFQTRGVVLIPDDLSLADWPARAKKAGLTTIALHHGASPKIVRDFIRSDKGQKFLTDCRKLGLEVEYELHAMRELLPRELFAKDPSLFRTNDKGERASDHNLCVASPRALEIVAENAVALAKLLRPTTSRYFLWGDDGQPWCRCPKCKEFSDSDQALTLENYLAEALHQHDARARVAHLAYLNTLPPPKQIKPYDAVFLEFAPGQMRHEHPWTKLTDPQNRAYLEALDANLKIFPRDTAQALEYWLDVSMASGWKKPAKKLPFDPAIVAADLKTYAERGVHHITTFAVFMDADYVARYGDAPLEEYGRLLK